MSFRRLSPGILPNAMVPGSPATLTFSMLDTFNLVNSNSPTIIQIPEYTSVAFPPGCSILFEQWGTGTVEFQPLGVVDLKSRLGRVMAGQNAVASLYKVGFNQWILMGDLTGAFGPLVDGATVAVDASNYLQSLTMAGSTSRLISNPTGAYDGARILFKFIQGSGSDTVTWDTQYQFTTGVPQPTLSTAIGAIDYVAFIYHAATSKWHCLATNANGYT